MFCTPCGIQAADGAVFCTRCGNPVSPMSTSIPLQFGHPGTNRGVWDGDVPEGVKGWSWGAFLLNWIWAIGNGTWIGLLALVPWVGFFVALWLGFKGREMAWKNGNWKSVEHFNRTQRTWSMLALVLYLVVIVGIVVAVMLPAYLNYVEQAHEAATHSV